MTAATSTLASEGTYSQVCYVVHDAEVAIDRWARITGAGPFYVFEAQEEDKRYREQPGSDRFLAALGFLGSMSVEFYQPLDTKPSILREVLDTRGEGVHHLHPRIRGYDAAGFDAECRRYEALGLEPAMTTRFVGTGRAAFYDAQDELGLFIEVLELGSGYSVLDRMYAAHREWKGERPMRDFSEVLS